MKDSIQRRSRFGRPQPKGIQVAPERSKATLNRLAFIRRHGPLSTSYIFEAAKAVQHDKTHFQRTLLNLSSEVSPYGEPYLDRLDAYHMEECSYDITRSAELLLLEHGMVEPFILKRIDPMAHRQRNAAFSASMELFAGDDISYVSPSAVISHEKCPAKTKALPNPYALPLSAAHPKDALIPDFVFGYRYRPSNSARIFVCETDCGTERYIRDNDDTTIYQKIAGYVDVFDCDIFKTHWGVPEPVILFLTANPDRMNRMIEIVRELTAHKPSIGEQFAFKWKKGFHGRWHPLPLMPDLVTDPWNTTTGPFFINKP